jgi:hypothetical protein
MSDFMGVPLQLIGLGAGALGTAGFFAGEKMAGAVAGVSVLGNPLVSGGLALGGAGLIAFDGLGLLGGKKG